MKVLSVLHFPEFGGPHNQMLRLAGPLGDHDVDYIPVLPDGPGAARLRQAGVTVRTLEMGRVRAVLDPSVQLRMFSRFPIDVWHFFQLFRNEQPAVVQINGLMNPHAAIVARAMHIPVVWQLLDTRPPRLLRKIMMWPVRHLADVLMPVGYSVANAHPGSERFKDRMVVFYPPVDTALFRPHRNSDRPIRAELGIRADAPVVGVVGNINPQKGHEYFVDAAAAVKDSVPEAKFVIAGHIYPNHREYYESLLSRAKTQNLIPNEDIFWLGSRQDIPDVLASIDVLALASVPNSEGTPTVILEAMACGVPVVASDVASVSEVVADGETGYVVPPMQPEHMAAQLVRLLKDPAQRETFGKQATTRVETEFSLEACVDAHNRAFQLAMAHRRGADNG
jgi:glycosyltransferase involved in cell wall biosynthesis